MARRKQSTKPAASSNPARLAMLARVERGELDHSAAAKELGVTPGVWHGAYAFAWSASDESNEYLHGRSREGRKEGKMASHASNSHAMTKCAVLS
jgi:hypothetical protein